MKTYLKSEKYGIEVSVFDDEKLCLVRVYKQKECEINDNFSDKEDLRDSLERDLADGFYPITEKEFYENLNRFKEELDILTAKN